MMEWLRRPVVSQNNSDPDSSDAPIEVVEARVELTGVGISDGAGSRGSRGNRDPGSEIRDSGCGIRDAGSEIRDLGCGMRDLGCGMRDVCGTLLLARMT